jgi:hypothetical protein
MQLGLGQPRDEVVEQVIGGATEHGGSQPEATLPGIWARRTGLSHI